MEEIHHLELDGFVLESGDIVDCGGRPVLTPKAPGGEVLDDEKVKSMGTTGFRVIAEEVKRGEDDDELVAANDPLLTSVSLSGDSVL